MISRLFTLLELLIVIAVIAILASLLLPALRQTKSKAKEIICLNNHKQIGLSFHEYISDMNVYPTKCTGGTGGDPTRWYMQMQDYLPGKVPQVKGGDNLIMYCSEKNSKEGISSTFGQTSYAYNSQGFSSTQRVNGRNNSQINNPSDTVLLICGAWWYHQCWDTPLLRSSGNPYSSIVTSPPHQKAYNVLFCDGHAGKIGLYDFKTEMFDVP